MFSYIPHHTIQGFPMQHLYKYATFLQFCLYIITDYAILFDKFTILVFKYILSGGSIQMSNHFSVILAEDEPRILQFMQKKIEELDPLSLIHI